MTWYKRILYTFCSTCRPNRSRTVRFAFPLVLGAIALLGAQTIFSNNKTYIEIVPSATSVKAGNGVSLDVFVNAHKPINAVDLTISIPDTQLAVKGIDTGESVITLWTVDPYFEDGKVILRGGTFRRGFVGKHLIATINTEAVTTGVAYVNVSDSLLLAGDGAATEISPIDTDLDKVKLYIANQDGTFSPESELSTTSGVFEASAEIMIITDIDGDGDVTIDDISRFMAAWRAKNVIYDFSGDGRMTFRDFAIILADSFLK